MTSTRLASCKKDYTCECTTTVTTPAYTVAGVTLQEASSTSTVATMTITDKKDAATDKCEAGTKSFSTDSGLSQFGGEPTVTKVVCGIK